MGGHAPPDAVVKIFARIARKFNGKMNTGDAWSRGGTGVSPGKNEAARHEVVMTGRRSSEAS
jgi:hypothetical protein